MRPFDAARARRQLERAGYVVVVLPADGIVDRATLFDAIRATLPANLRVIRAPTWAALADSLWLGLYAHPARRIAILWPGAATMATAAPSDFRAAVAVLRDVAWSLADPHATRDEPKHIAVLVEQVTTSVADARGRIENLEDVVQPRLGPFR